MLRVATHPDAAIVVSAAVGVVGLEATYAAVRLGKQVALSNKEVLVAAGELVMAAAAKQAASNCCPWIASTTPSTNACAPGRAAK